MGKGTSSFGLFLESGGNGVSIRVFKDNSIRHCHSFKPMQFGSIGEDFIV